MAKVVVGATLVLRDKNGNIKKRISPRPLPTKEAK